jgi:hypothetical protein
MSACGQFALGYYSLTAAHNAPVSFTDSPSATWALSGRASRVTCICRVLASRHTAAVAAGPTPRTDCDGNATAHLEIYKLARNGPEHDSIFASTRQSEGEDHC